MSQANSGLAPGKGRFNRRYQYPENPISTGYSVRAGWDPLAMEKRSALTPVVDLARARAERLEAEELRALAASVGDHLPVELSQRVERLRSERLALSGGELPPAA